MIAPELEKLISEGGWSARLLDQTVQNNAKILSAEDLPKIEGMLGKLDQRDRESVLDKIGEHSGIPKMDLARLAYRVAPKIENPMSLTGIFSGMTKEDFDQLAREGAVHHSRGGQWRFADSAMAKSANYMAESVVKTIDNLINEKESGKSTPEISNSLRGLGNLFNGLSGFSPITEQHKDSIANAVVKYMEKFGHLGEDRSSLSPVYAHLLRKSPNTIDNMHKDASRLPRLELTQDLLDASLEALRGGKLTPEKAHWLLNRSEKPLRGPPLSIHGEGEPLFDLLQRGGFNVGGALSYSDHKAPFRKIKSYIDSLTWAPGAKEQILSGAKISPEHDDEVVDYFGGLSDLIDLDGVRPDRTSLTEVIERVSKKHGGLGEMIPLTHRHPGKYNLSEQDQHKFVQRLADPGHIKSADSDHDGQIQIQNVLRMGSLAPSAVGRFLSSLVVNVKTKKHRVAGSDIVFGANHFASRSMSEQGLYTGDDPSLHPEDVVNVKIGSTVLRKLRDHLEKVGRLRPEELPKGESWNTIVKEIKDKAGNINYATDWNPLRASDGKLDAAVVQSHIDSMPARPFVLSYSAWDHPLQRHSKEKSSVVIANLHPDTIAELKKEGLYDKFLQQTVKDVHTIHPLGRDSIGWIRFTGNHKKGFHVDEVQSDLYGELRKSNDPDHKRIAQIVFGDAHPSEILHEVAQEYFRKNPKNIGVPWATHTVASKSPMALEEAKEAPVHFKVSYEQAPKRMGAKPSTYGTLRTQTGDNPKHGTEYALQGKPTWQDQIRKFEVPEPVDGRPQCVAIVVQNDDGKVLLGKGHDGRWNVTAGKCEPHEAHLKAAIREMYEESGLRPKNMEYHGLLPNPMGGVDLHCYTAVANGTPHGNFDPDAEFVDYTWVDPNGGEIEQYLPVMRFPPDVLLHVGVMKAGR